MDSSFTLRQFTPNDLDKVIYLNRVCLPENYSSYFFMDLFERAPETFIIAEEDGEIVGYIMCRIEMGFLGFRMLEVPKMGHIISIAVLPQHQKRGIGSALIRKALQAMTSSYRAKECYLEVRESNLPAINMYKKLGFKTTKMIRHYYADGENAYIMTRTLPFEE